MQFVDILNTMIILNENLSAGWEMPINSNRMCENSHGFKELPCNLGIVANRITNSIC